MMLLMMLLMLPMMLLIMLLMKLLRMRLGTIAASSSSSPVPKYDVFISFRGVNIRDNFLSHMLKELRRESIDVYEDERLNPGEEISSSLLQAIEESSISLVIFSKDYASSRWCMEELHKIIESMEHHQRIVIPVFYHVDPSDVRHQKGSFAEAFREHEKKFEKNVVKNWRSALKKTANLSGFHYPSKKYKNESIFIEETVNYVSEKLGSVFSGETKGLVGIDTHIKCIKSLFAVETKEVQILGIWGMGGIGKTTIAEVVFNKYSANYEGRCFLRNVRKELKKHGGLDYLLQKLVSDLLQDTNIPLGGLSTKQSENVKRRLGRKKVFIVLDDVDSLNQLEHLIEGQFRLRPGSKVIVTTRDKHILKKAHQVYEVQMLNFENSMQLFCLNAFSKTRPEKGYEKLSEMVVHYAKGIPLALKVLGFSLGPEGNIKVWESELERLKLHLPMEIVDELRWSYDKLSCFEKDIFLDIAFFFKGKKKDEVMSILHACGFYPVDGMNNLERKALITISRDKKIEMHHLNEQMGWHVVLQERQESSIIKDLTKRSRLRNHEEVYKVLKNNMGSNSIEGIMLDLSRINEDIHLHADTFKKMVNLRILKVVYASCYNERSSNVYLAAKHESFSDELRYLEWYEYPSKSLPSYFCAEKLVELRMPRSQVCKLDGVQDLVNLEILDLSGCKELTELPPNIKDLTRLTTLCIRDCLQIKSVPELPSSITALDADNCTSLQTVIRIQAISSYNWTMFSFQNCMSLDEDSLSGFVEVVHGTMMRCAIGDKLQKQPIYKEGDFCCPGSKVPEWFKYKTTEASISLQLDRPDHLSGFFLCFVIPQLSFGAIECEYYLGDGEKGRFEIPLVEIRDSLNSDHVYIWYHHYGNVTLDAIKQYRAVDHCTTHGQNISQLGLTIESLCFWDAVEEDEVEETSHCVYAKVKGCGFHPIYFSDIRNIIQDDKNTRNVVNWHSANWKGLNKIGHYPILQ